ncbi:hypothetical protein BH09BAC2_BH09BAC2_11470 [soil metagenome]
MRVISSMILIMLLSFVACLFLPWWSIAIMAFLVAVVIPLRAGIAFLAGFTALFILWGASAFWISSQNENILAHRVSLLILKADNPLLLILVTALIGALVAGLASMTGSFLRGMIFKDQVVKRKAIN